MVRGRKAIAGTSARWLARRSGGWLGFQEPAVAPEDVALYHGWLMRRVREAGRSAGANHSAPVP